MVLVRVLYAEATRHFHNNAKGRGCQTTKDQCASEKALAITTTRLPVINYMAGHLVVHCIVAQDVPTNGGAPPNLVGPRPH